MNGVEIKRSSNENPETGYGLGMLIDWKWKNCR
jgi:hypothetical protein